MLTIYTLTWTAATDNIGVIGYNIYQNGTLKTTTTTIAEKYSLKNIGTSSLKTSTFFTLRSSLEYKGMAAGNANTNYLKFNKGNISYVIPYRYKMVLPRFKTPSPTQP